MLKLMSWIDIIELAKTVLFSPEFSSRQFLENFKQSLLDRKSHILSIPLFDPYPKILGLLELYLDTVIFSGLST